MFLSDITVDPGETMQLFDLRKRQDGDLMFTSFTCVTRGVGFVHVEHLVLKIWFMSTWFICAGQTTVIPGMYLPPTISKQN
jgi:hypothetical protein